MKFYQDRHSYFFVSLALSMAFGYFGRQVSSCSAHILLLSCSEAKANANKIFTVKTNKEKTKQTCLRFFDPLFSSVIF